MKTPALSFSLLILALVLGLGNISAAEYFVRPCGDDAAVGLSKIAAFATIQKGVDALAAGDTLTIAPGEYAGGVSRDGLGNLEVETTIRAEIPGTAVLRGDVAAPDFVRFGESRHTYVADVDGDVQAVYEADSLVGLKDQVSRNEVEFSPGSFFFDRPVGKLYISTTDMRPPEDHVYTISTMGQHGLALKSPKRVVVEGLVFRGFYSLEPLKDSRPQYVVWGLYLEEPVDCVIRDCTAFLNGGGLLVVSGDGGGNLIEDCVGYGNGSPHNSEGGNVSVFGANNDTIRNCIGYRSRGTGVRIYGTARGKNLIEGSLGWGNGGPDLGMKGGGLEIDGLVKNSIGLGILPGHHLSHNLIGKKLLYLTPEELTRDNVFLSGENISERREFADPVNFDFRLQSTSKLRKTAPDGSDRGPLPYEANVYFVRATGNDEKDGLSLRNAWQTAGRALRDLKPGDTVYFDDGVYAGPLKISVGTPGEAPISLRARGLSQVVFSGPVTVESSSGLTWKRINFSGEVKVTTSKEIGFMNCRFYAEKVGLEAEGSTRLRIEHCLFTGSSEAGLSLRDTSDLTLSSSVFDNREGVGIRILEGKESWWKGLADRLAGLEEAPAAKMSLGEIVTWSDYNAYARPASAWSVAGRKLSLEQLQTAQDRYSLARDVDITRRDSIPFLNNRPTFAARDAAGQNIGFHQELEGRKLFMSKPQVHSVSATTANIEWLVSVGADCEVGWGETPECENKKNFKIETFEDLHRSFSLWGLKPNTKYYFQIREIKWNSYPPSLEAEAVDPNYEVIAFTTAASDPAPRSYYVAPEGSDTNSGLDLNAAWKTVSHAASVAAPGDTVLIAPGTYVEKVRVRNTGEEGRPITFKSLPGGRVIFDGEHRRLNNAWVINGKAHITVDGFYFYNHRGEPGGNSSTRLFNVLASRDILIRRCLMDGRGGGAYPASFLTAWTTENLTLSNCVSILAPDGVEVSDCPGFRVEHSVFILTMICNVKLGTAATLESNIFCDSGAFKSEQNIQVASLGNPQAVVDRNNCYYFRLPTEERTAFFVPTFPRDWDNPWERITLPALKLRVEGNDSIVADPDFAILKSLPPEKRTPFSVDALYSYGIGLTFSDLFTTNPELIKRGIGLQPEAFADFSSGSAPSTK